MSLGTYLVFVAVMCGLYYLAAGIPLVLDTARGMVTDISREVSFLFR
jgi:hypothetical protein